MASFGEAFASFLSTVGDALQDLVDDVKTPDTDSTPAQSTVGRTATATAPAPARTGVTTTVRLTVELPGDARSLLAELDRDYGNRTPDSVAAFVQRKTGARVTAWDAPSYPGYGSRA